MAKNITRADIAAAIYTKVGLSHLDSFCIIEDIVSEIIKSLKAGESVKIANFATFEVKHKHPRIGRNPKTKQEFPISERYVVAFKPSQNLKKTVA